MKNLFLLTIALLYFSSSRSQTLVAITPSQGTAGTTVTAILTGQNTFFMSSSPQGLQYFQLNNSNCRSLTGTNLITLNEDSIQVDLNIPANFVNDVYDVKVLTGPGLQLNLPGAFTVTGGVDLSIQGFTPGSVTEDSAFTAHVTGQNLQTLAGLPGFQLLL